MSNFYKNRNPMTLRADRYAICLFLEVGALQMQKTGRWSDMSARVIPSNIAVEYTKAIPRALR